MVAEFGGNFDEPAIIGSMATGTAKLSRALMRMGGPRFITDEKSVLEVIAVHNQVSVQDIVTEKYGRITLEEVDSGKWRSVDPSAAT